MGIIKASLIGYFLDRRRRLAQQVHRAVDPQLQLILMQRQSGVIAKVAAQPCVTDVQFVGHGFELDRLMQALVFEADLLLLGGG